MTNTELKTLALLAFGLVGGCRQSVDAQAAEPKTGRLALAPPPPPLPQLPKAQTATARPVARPREMPCAITSEDRSGSETMRTTYRLYYRRDGRLGLATKRVSTSYCRTTPCYESAGTEELVLRYEYDPSGRLTEVKHFWNDTEGALTVDRMTIAYSGSSKVERYVVVGTRNDRYADRHETKLAYDGYGELAASTTRGRMWMAGIHRVQTTTSMKDCREPYLSSPVVWPFEPKVLYFGWASRFDTLKIEGLEPAFHQDEFKFRSDGSLSERSSTLNGYTDKERWTFEFNCGEERAAEAVNLERN